MTASGASDDERRARARDARVKMMVIGGIAAAVIAAISLTTGR